VCALPPDQIGGAVERLIMPVLLLFCFLSCFITVLLLECYFLADFVVLSCC
jgi:hypothetical protein